VKFLLLNQAFHPDVAASGQYLADAAQALVERGHEVTVVTSQRSYDDPRTKYPSQETWRGIRIIRVGSTWFGKEAKWKRTLNFGSFMAACALRVALAPRPDVVVALTSPPLVSFLGAWIATLRHSRFIYWVMDLNPDEAIAAEWLRNDSMVTKALECMSRFSFNRSSFVIALDHFMRDRILAKGIPAAKVAVWPLWPRGVHYDAEGRECFRREHSLNGKFVVMYSGNHSPCHSLHTLLQAAQRLATDPNIVFFFVGGGGEFTKVQQASSRLKNVICLPYQPTNQLAATLSAADLQVIVMGDSFVGLVHPCKIYNLLSVAVPILYIGPWPSHVTELLESEGTSSNATKEKSPVLLYASARHGHADFVAEQIRLMRDARSYSRALCGLHPPDNARSSAQVLLPNLIRAFESA
jgi:glycosyltransferase involved in cell wall biosynthesis